MYKRSSGKSPSSPGSCTARVRILIAGIESVQRGLYALNSDDWVLSPPSDLSDDNEPNFW